MNSAWRIEFSPAARKALQRLDRPVANRITRFLEKRMAGTDDPRRYGKPLQGSRLGHLWRYRIGDFRIIADIQDDVLTVLVVRIGHRGDIYR